MPHWLTDILDADHPDMPWQPPAMLPTQHDIRDAIDRCDLTLVGGVTSAVAKQCFAKLAMAFEPGTKLTGDETRLRMAVWMEACGDLNDALWISATTEAIQTLKWMPKPSEFRALVSPQLDLARKRRRRLEAMLEAARRPPQQTAFVRESDAVRTRGMRDSFRKIGKTWKAAGYERQLAAMENRAPEAWAMEAAPDPAADTAAANLPALPRPSPEMQAATLAAVAQHHRAQGRTDYGAHLERRAAELAAASGEGPSNERPEGTP